MSNVIVLADSPERIAQVRELFLEYARSLSFNLCFQSFEKELAELPGDYASPGGTLLLALSDHQPAGCVALHRLQEGICEMKRLYVRPQFRGTGVGSQLVRQLIKAAMAMGYNRMRLDTVAEEMQDAVKMYRRLGFVEIPSYRENPMPSALYLELDLSNFEASNLSGNASARADKKTLGQVG